MSKSKNIYKRKDGRWEGRITNGYDDKGHTKYFSVYAKTYTEVKTKMDSFLKGEKKAPNKSSTVEYVCHEWLDSIRNSVKIATLNKYTNIINNHITPYMGKLFIGKLTADYIDKFLTAKLKNGRMDGHGGLSPKTVCDIATVIKTVVNFSISRGYTVSFAGKISLPRLANKETRVLTRPEQCSLESYVCNNLNQKSVGLLLALYTGLRIGELCALKWSDIDFENKILTVNSTVQRVQKLGVENKTAVICGDPKSCTSVRSIPLPNPVWTALKDLAPRGQNQAYILSGSELRPVEPRSYTNYFKRCLRECNISDINFHALRHTFATRCVEVGVDIKSLSEILGHSDVKITLNRYVHSSMEQKKLQIAKLETVF